jgi:hypothetical protein
MRRLVWAFSILCAAAALAACGDAGDHFLEFRCTASCPSASASPSGHPSGNKTTVAKLRVSLPTIPNTQAAGTYPLGVYAYTANGKAIAAGTKLTNPITIASNSTCNVTFTSGSSTGTTLTLPRAPQSVTFTYTPPSATCTAPVRIDLTASSVSANPQSATASFPGENSGASIKLSMVATPDPSSNGIYPLTISARDGSGKAIPPGTTLANPIQVTSNASCVVTFGTVAGGTLTQGLAVSVTGTVFLGYTPSNGGTACPTPNKIVVTAVENGAAPAKFSFSANSSSETAKVAKIAIALSGKPKLQSAGTFALNLTAYTANGRAIAPGATLAAPIQLGSDSSCNVSFTSPSNTGTSLALTTIPQSLTLSYTPPSGTCIAPPQITVDATSTTAKPSSVSLFVVGGTATVGSLALSMLAPPNPTTSGIYPFFVTAKDTKGHTIANGTPLSNPIGISSNAACVTTFGLSASLLATSLTLNTATSQIYLNYNPSLTTASCQAPANVQVTATAGGARAAKFAFTGTSPTPTPSAATVSRVTLSMPSTPNPLSPGTFSLVVSAFSSAGAIPPGTPLKNPINLTSNSSCSVTFQSGTNSGTALSLDTAVSNVTLNYVPPSTQCSPPAQVILSAFDADATPQSTTFSLLGGTSTVASITLSMLQPPDPQSVGTYPLFVTAKDSGGNVIPYGQTLTNPILFSSNASCATQFGTDPAGNFNQLYSMTNSTSQIYVQFNPQIGPSCPSPAGGNVIVTAIAPTGTSGTVSTTINWPF